MTQTGSVTSLLTLEETKNKSVLMETVSIHTEMDAIGIGRTQMVVVVMIPLTSLLMRNAALVVTSVTTTKKKLLKKIAVLANDLMSLGLPNSAISTTEMMDPVNHAQTSATLKYLAIRLIVGYQMPEERNTINYASFDQTCQFLFTKFT